MLNWKEFLNPYEQAVSELKLKFENMMNEYKLLGLYSPIESVTGRVKKPSSIMGKAKKKNIPNDRIEEDIEDIAGIRILCQFVEDIQKIVSLIKRRDGYDFKVVEERDYVTNTKPSGYRSYHVIIKYPINSVLGFREVLAEIQIRTLAMNFWATIEHSLQYKYKKNIPEHIRQRLSNAASAIVVLDEEMSAVRDVIMDAQDSFQAKANLVSDILNNMQNLYKVANKREILKIQDEFFRIYNSGDYDELDRFNKELDIIAEGYRAQSLK